MKSDTASILKQFEPIEQLYEELKSGRNGYPPARVETLYTMCLSVIERTVGKNSAYWERAQHALGVHFVSWSGQGPHLPETRLWCTVSSKD